MAIVKMKKLKLLISRADREDVLRDLLLLGCVEVSEPDALLADPEFAAAVEIENAESDRYRSDFASLTRALEIINEYAPEKTPLFAPKTEVSGDRLLDEIEASKYLDIAKNLEALDNSISRIHTEVNTEHNLIESLEPWAPLELPMNSEGTATSMVILGAIPSTTDVDALQEAVHAVAEEAQIFRVSTNKELHYLCVILLRSKHTTVTEVLRRFSFSVTSLKDLSGAAQENIRKSEQRLLELEEEKEKLTAQIEELAEHKQSLRLCYDHISTRIAREDATGKLVGTQYSLLLTGWLCAPQEQELITRLSKYSCAWELEEPAPEEYVDVPVALSNTALTSPLSMVTEMYSLPAYGSIDPNPLMMPFFVLFYGCMMADMGYGLLMIIIALFVKSKKLSGGTMKQLFDLMFFCGISTFVLGVLTGGLFGDMPAQLVELFTGRTDFVLYKAPLDPIGDPITVLIGALALGALHIIFGMGVKLYMSARDGHLLDGILDVVPWWILFAGIAFGALGITWYVAIGGAVLLVLTQGRAKPTIIGKFIGGIASLYDITSYFGDILSYSRIMALMLAGGVIAMVFNTVGKMTGNIVTFLIIFLIGHALNMGLNLLGCYVHDLRLQCLEFFGKFYQDGGRPFNPLRVKTKYNNLVKK